MKQLLRYPEVWIFRLIIVFCYLLFFLQVFLISSGCVELNPAFRDYEERSNRVDKVLRELRAENAFITLKGWRDEVGFVYCHNFFEVIKLF